MTSAKLSTALLCAVALTISCGGDDGTTPDGGGVGGPTPTTIMPSGDNTLYEVTPQFDPDSLYTNGGGTQMFAGKTAGGAGSGGDVPRIRRALVCFDVAGAIPAGATIDSVRLELFAVKGPNPANRSVSIHRVTADWGEGTVVGAGTGGEGGGGAPTNGDVTWDHTFFPTTRWTTRGGDFVGTASATRAVGALGGKMYRWGSTTMMVSDVQTWLDMPVNNFGWVVIGAEAPTDSITVKGFGTREQPAATRPRLQVFYTGP